MVKQYTTYSVSPPTSQVVGEDPSGTITNIACGGPCDCTITTAAGATLMSIRSPGPINMPVSLAFTGGAPTVTQRTDSSITLTI